MKKKFARRTVEKLAPPVARQLDRLTAIENSIGQLHGKIDQLASSASAHDSRLDELRKLVSKVEPYQPTYGVSGVIDIPKRDSADRCRAIMDVFDGDVTKYKVLDIGSSLGYVSFFLADRGANVEGWEVSMDNLAAAKAIQAVNGIPVNFLNKALDLESVRAIPKDKFDIAIVLSVFHHVIYDEGLETTQEIVKELINRVPILIVELARNGEDKKLWWDSAQPKNELDIFKGLDVNIETIGEANTHLSNNPRNLYKITRKNITVNHKIYPIRRTSRIAYPKSPVPLSGLRREYITSDRNFIKHYYFNDISFDNADQIINEINVLNSLKRTGKKHPLMINMKDFEIRAGEATVVFEKIEGRLAEEAPELVKLLGYDKIQKNLIDILAFLEEAGYHHNDIRSWNVMVTKNHATLVDYGLTAPLPVGNAVHDLIRAMHAIITGRRESANNKKSDLPPKTEMGRGKSVVQLYELAQKGETSFVAIKKTLYGKPNKS